MHVVSKAFSNMQISYDKKTRYLYLSICIWCCSIPEIHKKKEPLTANNEHKTSMLLLLTFDADGI